ncbi:MAG: hypothetical protein DWQ05_16860 [Calditrichaeota bacterium]|nr:MAG: hypothetical protein DWQ05_16860 [Calditrichota bacterium]
MQKLQTESDQNPENTWGVETMDSWKCFRLVRELYLKLNRPANSAMPLVLSFRPSAERAALHYLQWLSRLGRSASGMAVLFYGSGKMPFVGDVPDISEHRLLLIHKASRFIDMQHLLQLNEQHENLRLVLTVPETETEIIKSWGGKFWLEQIPAFEDSYTEKKADEIIAHYLGRLEEVHPQIDLLLQIIAEAGRADVQLPLSFVAKHVQLENRTLFAQLLCEPMSAFVTLLHEHNPRSAQLQFRGRWLAEALSIAGKENRTDFPHLTALVHYADPNLNADRRFLLNLLVALWIAWRGSDRLHFFMALHREKIAVCYKSWQHDFIRNYNRQKAGSDHPFLIDFYQSWQAVTAPQNKVHNS